MFQSLRLISAHLLLMTLRRRTPQRGRIVFSFLLFVFSFTRTNFGLAQIDTTLRDYFPLSIGNVWEYEEVNPPFSFRYQIRATRDSVMANGRRYTLLFGMEEITERGFYRIDDSMRVFKHSTEFSQCFNAEYLVYDLHKIDRSIWYTCIPSIPNDSLPSYIGIPWTRRMVPYSRLGLFADTKMFCEAQVRIPQADTIFCPLVPRIAYTPRRLAKGVGLVWTQFEGPPHELVGAIINGVRYGTVTSVGSDQLSFPEGMKLFQNYPNPFNGTTSVKYYVNLPNIKVRVELHDVLGRRIRTLVNSMHQAGEYKVEWDGNDESGIQVSSGTYFLKIQSGDEFRSQKIVLLR